MYSIRKTTLCIFLFVIVSSCYSQIEKKTKEYTPTKNRFENFDQFRTLIVNNKPLTLDPFEMFDIMHFVKVGTGYDNYLMFALPETGEEFYFNAMHNQFTYNGDFNSDYEWTGNRATVILECATGENLVRILQKNKKYKVIYDYNNDSELSRKPYPTESNHGYYIVDVIELDEEFEREKPQD